MIGERIRAARLHRKLSLSMVAEAAGVSTATLSRIENDKQSVDVDLFLRLARAIGVMPRALFDGVPPGGDGGEALADRLATLAPPARAAVWRLAAAQQQGRKRQPAPDVSQQIDALVAQLDFIRNELEALRQKLGSR